MLGKEPDDLGFEHPMKRRAVEICRRVGADAWHGDGQLRGAGREEGEVRGVRDVDVGIARKRGSDPRGATRISAVASALGTPYLQRDLDRSQIELRERGRRRRVGEHGRLDSGVTCPGYRNIACANL